MIDETENWLSETECVRRHSVRGFAFAFGPGFAMLFIEPGERTDAELIAYADKHGRITEEDREYARFLEAGLKNDLLKPLATINRKTHELTLYSDPSTWFTLTPDETSGGQPHGQTQDTETTP